LTDFPTSVRMVDVPASATQSARIALAGILLTVLLGFLLIGAIVRDALGRHDSLQIQRDRLTAAHVLEAERWQLSLLAQDFAALLTARAARGNMDLRNGLGRLAETYAAGARRVSRVVLVNSNGEVEWSAVAGMTEPAQNGQPLADGLLQRLKAAQAVQMAETGAAAGAGTIPPGDAAYLMLQSRLTLAGGALLDLPDGTRKFLILGRDAAPFILPVLQDALGSTGTEILPLAPAMPVRAADQGTFLMITGPQGTPVARVAWQQSEMLPGIEGNLPILFLLVVAAMLVLVGSMVWRLRKLLAQAVAGRTEAVDRALNDRDSFLSAVLDATSDGIVTVDSAGLIVTWNRQAEALFGWGAADMVGQSLDRVIPAGDQASHRAHVEGFFGGVVSARKMNRWRMIRGITRDRAEIPLRATLSRIGAPGHEMAAVTLRDMSDIVAAQQELAAAERARQEALAEETRAAAANQAKSAFLAHMSHELRTPLNAIGNYCLLLEEEIQELGHGHLITDLKAIQVAKSQLLAIISDVLDLSKIEAGRLELMIEQMPLETMISDIKALADPLAAANGNELAVKLHGTAGHIETDPTRLRQCLINLLGNAAKFTKDGKISLDVHAGDELVRFVVADTGIGMTAEQMARLFSPFAQADAATAARFGGTGLGLALTKSLMEMLGGRVAVQSRMGEGSVFTLELPRHRPANQAVMSSAAY